MKARIQLTEGAQGEHLAILRYYRSGGVEIARAFNHEFQRQLRLLKDRPRLGAPYLEGTRRKVFRQFPYSFVYVLEAEDLITIHAVPHHSQDPDYWLERVKARRR
ncbi:type II toxin-antitoxin system RelE/ParE family toxin [Longimicrobium sp.]|uniref:type II toxin-antitoxin system RelE/ParE family toxin n=1 Tax=Longimicrobium sp. TaxID=2029185 RepID=UPI002E31806C|nr:type II toxin-antitoxin system RelE/ParE family toxin [Longimicrobium sp.]HEX6038451.1 type II toxin-antitoxin system RelE/ParE family toxin [Longimicrobium sp.]